MISIQLTRIAPPMRGNSGEREVRLATIPARPFPPSCKITTAHLCGWAVVESALLHHHLNGIGQWRIIWNMVALGKKGPYRVLSRR